MDRVNNTPSMDRTIEGACNAVDIAGYNYMHNRYLPDLEKYPERVIVGSETYTKFIYDMWEHIKAHNNVIGDFCWTGWDYLGETGIGTVSYRERDYHDGFYAEYPCISAYCGDFDLTGFRLPQSYYREIVFGLRKEPYIAVHDPAHAGEKENLSTWGWGDVVSSWDFRGFEGTPLTVDVYADGEVELCLNGKSLGKKCPEKCKCSFTVPYESGVLKAVCGGKSYILKTAEESTELHVTFENGAHEDGIVFVNVELTDKNGVVRYGKDRTVTLEVSHGELLGFGNGAPFTEESYTDNVHTTFRGRAYAVVKTKEKDMKVVASADGVKSVTAKLN